MYLLVSDNWIRNNMFHTYECGSWYSSVYMEGDTSEWCVTANKKGKISSITIGGHDSWTLYGPAFLSKDFTETFFPLLESDYHRPGTEQCYWEHVLLNYIDKLDFYVNCQPEASGATSLKIWKNYDCSIQNTGIIQTTKRCAWFHRSST